MLQEVNTLLRTSIQRNWLINKLLISCPTKEEKKTGIVMNEEVVENQWSLNHCGSWAKWRVKSCNHLTTTFTKLGNLTVDLNNFIAHDGLIVLLNFFDLFLSSVSCCFMELLCYYEANIFLSGFSELESFDSFWQYRL